MDPSQEARDRRAVPDLQRRGVVSHEARQEGHVGLDLRREREEGERAGGAECEGDRRDACRG